MKEKQKYTVKNLVNAKKQAERLEVEGYPEQARMFWKYYQEIKNYLKNIKEE